ncbi:MAG TPA: glutathione S-transferase C-terminal domain-containing protein [Streptosporangiaceae bacterium]
MPAMSQRPSSPEGGQARPAGGPPWEVSVRPPAATGPPRRRLPARAIEQRAIEQRAIEQRAIPGRAIPPRAMPPQPVPPRALPPQGLPPRGLPPRGLPPRGLPPRASLPPGSQPPGHGEPPWPASTPPGSGTFTYANSDSAPSTGSLPAITGGLIRRQGTFTGRITRDGSSEFLLQPSRYQLYASLGCPWSQRTLIACRLLGLDRVVGLTLTDPVADEHGWRFADQAGDPLTGARYLSDLYRATDPRYTGPCTVPLIWDLRSHRVVSNDVAQITVMLETEFRPFHRPGAPDLYPAARRREIESLATLIFHTVNTGVYKAGLATTQSTYDQAVEALFTTLDALDERLARRRFLLGDLITEADIRLYPTLARFDAVYYPKFGCNLRRLSDYRHLWAYTRDLYNHPGFGETTDLRQIKRHYYQSTEWLNITNKYGIVPIGPQINWNEPHGRARMPS